MNNEYDIMLVAKSKKKLARTLAGVGRTLPVTSSKVAGSVGVTTPAPGMAAAGGSDAGSEDDKFVELDAAGRIRGIDVDSDTGSELSDADSDLTGVISMFSKARVSENKDSRRDCTMYILL